MPAVEKSKKPLRDQLPSSVCEAGSLHRYTYNSTKGLEIPFLKIIFLIFYSKRMGSFLTAGSSFITPGISGESYVAILYPCFFKAAYSFSVNGCV